MPSGGHRPAAPTVCRGPDGEGHPAHFWDIPNANPTDPDAPENAWCCRRCGARKPPPAAPFKGWGRTAMPPKRARGAKWSEPI